MNWLRDIADAIVEIAKTIGDPIYIIFFIIILGMFVLLIYKDRCLLRVIETHKQTASEIVDEVHETNVTMAKLTTLIEVLIYGKDRGS